MSIIEMETLGCMVGLLYIIIMFFATAAMWYAFTFIMWRLYRYNGGKHGYFSYIRIKELEL